MTTETPARVDEGTYVLIKRKPATISPAYAPYAFKGAVGKVKEAVWSTSHLDNMYTLWIKDPVTNKEYPIPFIPESCLELLS
ncbi:hypothetical protein D9619_005337 [Psilocybe cf. subviscida]|uniref:Uncharacterized protein n=1 Tax=Psilocybe cf. subviscida TaxID=2480587 RepID=A0A8H5BVF3_9AGAR|nr:hypothetical protein D9619_005337 [Psilocybe cf. subviscida]